jgi:hypothetical protein
VRPSSQAGGGLGVFATQAVEAGTVLTAFGGYAYLARDSQALPAAAAKTLGASCGNKPLADYEKRLM